MSENSSLNSERISSKINDVNFDDNFSIKTTDTEKEKKANRSSMFTIKRKIAGKRRKINLYNTATYINAPIINAISGYPYQSENEKIKYKIGTKQETSLFKVRFITRENGVPGLTLFFDNPEQYERHFGCKVDRVTKNSFYERRKLYEKNVLQF